MNIYYYLSRGKDSGKTEAVTKKYHFVHNTYNFLHVTLMWRLAMKADRADTAMYW